MLFKKFINRIRFCLKVEKCFLLISIVVLLIIVPIIMVKSNQNELTIKIIKSIDCIYFGILPIGSCFILRYFYIEDGKELFWYYENNSVIMYLISNVLYYVICIISVLIIIALGINISFDLFRIVILVLLNSFSVIILMLITSSVSYCFVFSELYMMLIMYLCPSLGIDDVFYSVSNTINDVKWYGLVTVVGGILCFFIKNDGRYVVNK